MVRIGKCPICKMEMMAERMHIQGEKYMVICPHCCYQQEAKDHQIIGNVVKKRKPQT